MIVAHNKSIPRGYDSMHTLTASKAKQRDLQLPEKLQDCIIDNKAFVTVAESYFMHLAKPPARGELFEALARQYFPEWQEAKDRLDQAQKNLDSHDAPIGSIGRGLDGGKMAELEDKVMMSLVHFTIINERLHQDKDVKSAMDLLHYIQVTLPAPENETLRAMSLTQKFENIAAPTAKPAPATEVQSNWMQGTLSGSFRSHRQQRMASGKMSFHRLLNDGMRQLLQATAMENNAPQRKNGLSHIPKFRNN